MAIVYSEWMAGVNPVGQAIATGHAADILTPGSKQQSRLTDSHF
jgi:hypothetical protein